MRRVPTRALLLGALLAGSLVTTPTAAAGPAEGDLDTTFSGDGKLIADVVPAAGDALEGIDLQADGKPVMVLDAPNAFYVARLTAAGAVDTSFNGTGRRLVQIGTSATLAKAVIVQPDGRIVVAGELGATPNRDVFVMRFTSSGIPDTTFSGDGVATIPVPRDGGVAGIAIAPDGNIVVAGNTTDDVTDDALLVRLTGSGAPDTGFSGDGVATFSGPQIYLDASAVVVQDDGKVVMGGESGDNSTTDLYVARVTTGGGLDTSFSGTGMYLFDDEGGYVNDLAIQPDGRILVGGQRYVTSTQRFTLLRLTGGGTLDETFGSGGVVVPFNVPGVADSIAVQPNGAVVAIGSVNGAWRVARLTPWGALDTSFARPNGSTVLDFGTDSDAAREVFVQPDGRIVATGILQSTGMDQAIGIARYIGDTTVPYNARMIGVPGFSLSKTRTLAWGASDDNTGVATYDVRQKSAAATSSAYGSTATFKAATSVPYGSFTGSAGRTYCFSVRAQDVAGNTGAYGPWSCMGIPINDRSLARTGSWTSPSSSAYYLGTASKSSSAGATLKLAGADYRRLSLVATTCSGCGTVKVYLGATLLKTVSLAASSTHHKVVIAIDTSASLRSGTITIKQASGGKPVTIEGLAIALN